MLFLHHKEGNKIIQFISYFKPNLIYTYSNQFEAQVFRVKVDCIVWLSRVN